MNGANSIKHRLAIFIVFVNNKNENVLEKYIHVSSLTNSSILNQRNEFVEFNKSDTKILLTNPKRIALWAKFLICLELALVSCKPFYFFFFFSWKKF